MPEPLFHMGQIVMTRYQWVLPGVRIWQAGRLIELCQEFSFCRLHIVLIDEKHSAAEKKSWRDMFTLSRECIVKVLCCFGLQIFFKRTLNGAIMSVLRQLRQE